MSEKQPGVNPLVDVKGYEFKPTLPEEAEVVVDLFFGKGHPAMHDSYAIDGDNVSMLESGPVTDLIANGRVGMVDWNTDRSSGFIDLKNTTELAVTAQGDIPVLMIGEKINGKIAIVHRFWKAPVVEQE